MLFREISFHSFDNSLAYLNAVLYLGVRRLALRYTTFTCNIGVTRIPKHATRINISSNSFKRKYGI